MLVSFIAMCGNKELDGRDTIDQCAYIAKKISSSRPSLTPICVMPEHFDDTKDESAFSVICNGGFSDFKKIIKSQKESIIKIFERSIIEV